jgi:hypothetical protein
MTAAPCGARLPVRATTRGSRTAVASSAQPSIVEAGRQKVSVLSETAVSYQTYPHARTIRISVTTANKLSSAHKSSVWL